MNNILLKDYLIEITKGTTPTTIGGEFIESGVNFVKAECLNTGRIIDKSSLSYISPEIHKKLNRSILQEDDLLFSIAGHLGKMAIVRKEDLPANTNQAVAILRIDQKKGDVNFLYYYLNSTQISNYIRKQCAQSVQPNLNLAQVGQLPIIVYSLPTQKSIAKVLSDLDAKIELNNKINRELEAMAKTLYDYWFVQFDFPTPPSSTSGIVGKPYKSSGGKMVYNAELKREIPEGWEVKNLFKSCIVQYGFPFSTEYFNSEENGVPVIRIRDILDNTISNYSTEKKLDEKYLIKKGDLLIGMDGNFHINYWSKNECYLNQRVVKLSETILPNIILKYQIEPYIKLREKSVSRTTVGHLSDKDLKALNLFIPSKEVLASVSPLFNKTLNRIIQTQNENQQLSSLRDWLLPMLMNGQVASRASATGESRASATEE